MCNALNINKETPSLISKGRSERFSEVSSGQRLPQRTRWNRKRAHRVSTLARKARRLYDQVDEHLIHGQNFTTDDLAFLSQLRRNLGECAKRSLYRRHHDGNIEYISSKLCGHKMCPVCNAERYRKLRKKYMDYFEKGEFIDRKSGEVFGKEGFDFMHLTLTLPHDENGYQGEVFYAKKLMELFNHMRKRSWWKSMVFAGEFGVEVTKNDNGLHIHIHSLLVVHKSRQNRNILHREILLWWNRNTANREGKEFTEDQKRAIKAGNKLITDLDIECLNSSGATIIGLENLYVWKATGTPGKQFYDQERKKWKHYVDTRDSKQFMAGVLECIKYHFEPIGMKESGVYDLDLLLQILPQIKNRPLYRKFGNFHGVKELNIKSNVKDQINEALEDHGGEVRHPETGEVTNDHEYVLANPSAIGFEYDKDTRPYIPMAAKVQTLAATSITDALLDMLSFYVSDKIREKQRSHERINQYQLE